MDEDEENRLLITLKILIINMDLLKKIQICLLEVITLVHEM